jgi:glycerate-2-kinase
MDMTQRKQLVNILSAALTAVDPYPAVTGAIKIERECLQVARRHLFQKNTGPTGTNVMDLQIMVVEET